MIFSERMGKTSRKTALIREEIDEATKNRLWSIVDGGFNKTYSHERATFTFVIERIWDEFYRHPTDTIPYFNPVAELFSFPSLNSSMGITNSPFFNSSIGYIREWYFSEEREWYEFFDFIEFLARWYFFLIAQFNRVLEEEHSAYRFVGNQLVVLTSEEEIKEIETAVTIGDTYAPAKTHLEKAINLYGDRQKPDFANSIKESISAVEAVAKIILDDNKSTLGHLLPKLKQEYDVPAVLTQGFSALYGYASNEARHGLPIDGRQPTLAEARFMLVACSAFVNYIIDTCKTPPRL